MSFGTVKWFSHAQGYGVIEPEDGTAEVVVDMSAVAASGLGSLRRGQNVRFDVEKNPDTGRRSATHLQPDC